MTLSRTDAQVLTIVGPTAVGKSALALHLASRFDGEIVNADSRQVYRGMDIGTAKPSPEERSQVPHHLIDILNPGQDFSLALFLTYAGEAISDIQARNKLPIVTGGTGQYIWGLLEGWQVPLVPPDPELRQTLEKLAQLEGFAALHNQLHRIDPASADRIDPSNLRRVIRALEVYQFTGKPPSHFRHKITPPYHSHVIGLSLPRDPLYRRIDTRVDKMVESGLVQEVQNLLDAGYSSESPCMLSMGYKEIAMQLKGELTLEEACQRIKYATHRFARRQFAWFRGSDSRISWLEADSELGGNAELLVEQFMSKNGACGKIGPAAQERFP